MVESTEFGVQGPSRAQQPMPPNMAIEAELASWTQGMLKKTSKVDV
jgi:hypothetical protein